MKNIKGQIKNISEEIKNSSEIFSNCIYEKSKPADKRFAQPFAAHGSSGATPGEKQGVGSGIEPGHGLLQPLENGAQKKGRQQEQRGGEQEDDDVGCKGGGSVCVLKKVYCKA